MHTEARKRRSECLSWFTAVTCSLAVLAIASAFAYSGKTGVPRDNQESAVVAGIVFDKYIVCPANSPTRQYRLDLVSNRMFLTEALDKTERVAEYIGVRSRFLAGHPMRLQGSLGQIWQIQLETISFFGDVASSQGSHCIDNEPAVRILETRDPQAPLQEIVRQRLSSPIAQLSIHLSSKWPELRSAYEKALRDKTMLPLLNYDFSIKQIESRQVGGKSERGLSGIVFLQHRHERDRFVLAIEFPAMISEPRIERIDVPFMEPFHCVCSSRNGYVFVTDSGRVYAAPTPATGRGRASKPLDDNRELVARVLLRLADSGDTWVFVREGGDGSVESARLFAASGEVVRRELPGRFLADLEGKPTTTILWKCAEFLRTKP